MGLFRIQNASDELKAVILDAWKIPQGAVFNEGALREFAAVHNSNPTLQRLFATVNAFYSLKLHDNVHTVDVDLSLERKH
jgi:hypothetical protein